MNYIYSYRTGSALALTLLCASVARLPAQGVAQPQHTVATSLPLSSRSGQNGSVNAVEAPIPGTTTSVTTINPSVQIQGPYAGSADSTTAHPFSGHLSLLEAVQRALNYNLGALERNRNVLQAKGQTQIARSALLPNASGYLAETIQQVNLAAQGLRIHLTLPGFSFPTVVGPFNNFDVRGQVSQSVLDLTAWNNYRASRDLYQAAQLSARDARESVVLAVCGAYLQVIATRARVKSAHAELDTANALFNQTQQQRAVGVSPQIDVDRAEVEKLTQQQRVVSLETELSKEKIGLARITGLPPNDNYDLTDEVPFAVAPPVTLDDAIHQALTQRTDIQAAEAQVRAAQHALAAAHSERIPSLAVTGNYGAIGPTPSQTSPTYAAAATLSIPVWLGGRTEGEINQARAALDQRQSELADLRAQVEGDVREAFLDLEAATTQVQVAQRNLQVSRETLDLTRQRYDAGINDNLSVIQAQESLTSAELDVINSAFAHNLAKLSLARAIASASGNLQSFLQ